MIQAINASTFWGEGGKEKSERREVTQSHTNANLLSLTTARLLAEPSEAEQAKKPLSTIVRVTKGDKLTHDQLLEIQQRRKQFEMWTIDSDHLESVIHREQDTRPDTVHVFIETHWPGGHIQTCSFAAEPIDPNTPEDDQCEEISLWQLNGSRPARSLYKALRTKPLDEVFGHTQWARLTRLASDSTQDNSPKNERKMHKTVTMALAYQAAVEAMPSVSWFATMNSPGLRDVFSFTDEQSNRRGFSFPTLDSVLTDFLPPEEKPEISLVAPLEYTKSGKNLREYALYWPGYWLDPVALCDELKKLLTTGTLKIKDFSRLFKNASTLPQQPQTTDEIINWLSEPKHVKWITQLFIDIPGLFDTILSRVPFQPELCAYSLPQLKNEVQEILR